MIEKLSTALAKEGKHANVSPEMLEMMGKSAANTFIEKGISLNESISKLAAAHDDINQEQVKRICEFANTAVYLAKHDMSKTAGSKESYPEFDLADPNRVIQDLSDGTKSTVTTKVDADYSRLPQKVKESMVKEAKGPFDIEPEYIGAMAATVPLALIGRALLKKKASIDKAEEALEDLFMPKTAEDLDFSKQSAIDEVMSAKDQLNGLRHHLSVSGEQFDMMHKEASEYFYELSKRHMMSEGSLVDIVKAAQATGATGEEVNEVVTPVIKRLMREKVASSADLSSQMSGFVKVAHRTINQEHPMVKAAGAIVSANQEMDKIAHGLQGVEDGLRNVNSFIKEKLSARTSR